MTLRKMKKPARKRREDEKGGNNDRQYEQDLHSL